MKKNIFIDFLFIVMIIVGTPALAVIEINDIEELQKIGNDSGYPLDGDYILGNDIDASATVSWNGGKGFKPIAPDTDSGSEFYQGTYFTGTFDGKGYTINILYIYRPDEEFVGLFGATSQSSISQI